MSAKWNSNGTSTLLEHERGAIERGHDDKRVVIDSHGNAWYTDQDSGECVLVGDGFPRALPEYSRKARK